MNSRLISAATFVLFTAIAHAQAPPRPVIHLRHANVLDGLTLEPKRDVTVIIEGGRIGRIATGTPDAPAGATVVDVKGRWVLPGLIDAHSHLNTLAAAKLALESGATTVRTAGVGGYADVAIRDMVRSGVLPGPDILATGVFVTPKSKGRRVGPEADPVPHGQTNLKIERI